MLVIYVCVEDIRRTFRACTGRPSNGHRVLLHRIVITLLTGSTDTLVVRIHRVILVNENT